MEEEEGASERKACVCVCVGGGGMRRRRGDASACRQQVGSCEAQESVRSLLNPVHTRKPGSHEETVHNVV